MNKRCGSCGRRWHNLYSRCAGCGWLDPEWKISEDPRVNRSASCHVWTGPCTTGGYGQFGGRYVHILIWEEQRGAIPDGMNVCHTCDNPPCLNLDHLFLGTQQENMADALGKGRLDTSGLLRKGEWTHCKRGHEFTEENTYRYPKHGRRECRICMKERSKKSGEARAKRKAMPK